MDKLLLFLVTFTVVYILYLFTVVLNKRNQDSLKNSQQMLLIKQFGKIKGDLKASEIKSLLNVLSLSDAFILAFTFTIIDFFDNYILKMLVGLVIFIPLIILSYKLIGKKYKKKIDGKDNNV